MAKTKATGLTVSLEPTPKAAEALSLLHQAQGLRIVDRATHEACRQFIKGAKALKREVVAHYDAIKKPINVARNTVLDLERQHVAPIDAAIAAAERIDTAWVREQERIEREAADAARRQAEAEEQARRDKEAAEAEAAALKLEASSNVLSEREQRVIDFVAAQAHRTLTVWEQAVKKAGYKDVAASVNRMINSEKINAALIARDKAIAIRREADVKKAAPIIVNVPAVESQIGKMAGTSVRTYYSCGDVDLTALILAAAESIKSGDASVALALEPNMTFLNEAARSLKDMFPKVHPYAALVKRDGIAG